MGKLIVQSSRITPEGAEKLIKICPFGAISYTNGAVEISSACKMCKMCVRKGEGMIEFAEDEIAEIDKSLWRGVCVYADCTEGKLHRVTLELCGKARELASVTGHPVYAILIGSGVKEAAEKLLHYGVDRVFVYENEELRDFRIEPYTATFCDFIEKEKPF